MLDDIVVFSASYLPYIIVAVFVAVVVWRLLPTKGIFVAATKMPFVALLSVGIARGLVKPLIVFFWSRPRPYIAISSLNPLITPDPTEAYASFPSGHAVFFFALAMAVWHYDRRLGRWFFASAATVSIARVAAGLHWPSDVIGGALIGILTAEAVRHALRFFHVRLRR